MDYAGKQSKWDIIAYEMKVLNATECKQRWNYIRDSYRRSLRRTLTKGGYPKKHVYKYAKELEFLKKHLSEKNPKKIYETEITEQIDEQNESETMNDETNCERDSDFSHDSQEANNSTNKQMFEHIDLPVEDDEVPGLYEIEEPNLSQDTVSLQLLKYLTKNKDFKSATTEKHPVDLFLTFISRTLKSLDAYHLNLAKSEIFATAQKYEMQMILNQSSGQSTANQPNSP
uniref:Uncharacterized protein LOC114342137 n=1 Tax=Diabrotica virgifera virgifera TaxID=50390 RepID=A0A6P7GTP0_DIAVI